MSELSEKTFPEVEFNYNWNNKLNCKAFTTFRIHNDQKFIVGYIYTIKSKNLELYKAQLLEKRIVRLKDVNEFTARIDTGYSLEEFKSIIKKMYPKIQDIENQLFDFCLFLRCL